MKATLQPVILPSRNEREKEEYNAQLDVLKQIYSEEAIFLDPVVLGEPPIPGTDAFLFVQLTRSIFQCREATENASLPYVALTSSFGTIEMWDWEIIAFLREETGCTVFSPYNVALAKVILRALGAKRKMREGLRFLVFQDSPGEGMQANIFKKFYWWEQDAIQRIQETFGVEFVYRSYKELNNIAEKIDYDKVRQFASKLKIPTEGVSEEQYLLAIQLYLAIKQIILNVGKVYGVGANCLNESFLSKTTPCLAWNLLFERDGILWVCEGDIVSLISEFITYSALKRPVLTTNLYPFLMGMAALKHERIEEFPEVEDPDNCALGIHCGYFGLAPQSFCSRWVLKPKVLEIVNNEAVMVDCEMAIGDVVLAKLHPNMKKITIIESTIERYVHYPNSDCLNGALLRFKNRSGHQIMQALSSHHSLIIQGDCTHELVHLAMVYGFEYEIF